jgi:hypothetical protein
VLTGLIAYQFGQQAKVPPGTPVPGAADVANAAACTAFVQKNWNGYAGSGVLAVNVATIALSLIGADPGGFVRYVGYYDFGTGSPTLAGIPYLPPNCSTAITAGVGWTNGVERVGITTAKIIRLLSLGDPSRIGWVDPQCGGQWNPASNFVQLALFGNPAAPNNNLTVPGYPHPVNPTGTNAIANCVNLSLPRTVAGGLVPLGGVAAPPPSTPEAPLILLLPIAAVGVCAAAVWILRRRRVTAA